MYILKLSLFVFYFFIFFIFIIIIIFLIFTLYTLFYIFWSNQAVYYRYDFRCDIAGNRNGSVSQNWLVIMLKYVVRFNNNNNNNNKEVDIEASSLHLQYWYCTKWYYCFYSISVMFFKPGYCTVDRLPLNFVGALCEQADQQLFTALEYSPIHPLHTLLCQSAAHHTSPIPIYITMSSPPKLLVLTNVILCIAYCTKIIFYLFTIIPVILSNFYCSFLTAVCLLYLIFIYLYLYYIYDLIKTCCVIRFVEHRRTAVVC